MFYTNRETRHKVVRALIASADPKVIEKLFINSGYRGCQDGDDPEFRRNELLEFVDEAFEAWNRSYRDMTDRQFVKIEEVPSDENTGVSDLLSEYYDQLETVLGHRISSRRK
ncbi:MAG: hypothetical protein IKD77_01820 [Bacilli bacterium]|nr:hypothetical protein [Bacilli bacterium]